MNRLDMVILRRLGSRIAVTVIVLFGLIALAESLDTWRFEHLSSIGGPGLGLLAIVTGAARWALGTLPVTLLIGAIIGLLDLQARREMTVIKAAGLSIWQMLRAPILAVIVFSVLASLLADTVIVSISRMLVLNMPQASNSGQLWLEQKQADGQQYILLAEHPLPGGVALEDVTIFLPGAAEGSRIKAKSVVLRDGAWEIAEGMQYDPDKPARPITGLRLETDTTPGDMEVRLASPADLTIFELWGAMQERITNPDLRHQVETRLARLVALPVVLVGSLLIAFAFTTGYRRTNKYGVTVLYGIVLGFVVYVVSEIAALAGASGILSPAFAAAGPAFVAIIIGTTVLLFREDGQA